MIRGGVLDSGDEEDDEELDAEQRIYQELLEEQAARKRAAALEALNEIHTGQAFSTMRVFKRNEAMGLTRAPMMPRSSTMEHTTAQLALADLPLPRHSEYGSSSPLLQLPAPAFGFKSAAQQPMDLSSLLPGPAFLPSHDAPGASASRQSSHDPAAAAAASLTPRLSANVGLEGVVDPSPGEAAMAAPEEGPPSPDKPEDEEDKLRAKLMATWHFAEVS